MNVYVSVCSCFQSMCMSVYASVRVKSFIKQRNVVYMKLSEVKLKSYGK